MVIKHCKRSSHMGACLVVVFQRPWMVSSAAIFCFCMNAVFQRAYLQVHAFFLQFDLDRYWVFQLYVLTDRVCFWDFDLFFYRSFILLLSFSLISRIVSLISFNGLLICVLLALDNFFLFRIIFIKFFIRHFSHFYPFVTWFLSCVRFGDIWSPFLVFLYFFSSCIEICSSEG